MRLTKVLQINLHENASNCVTYFLKKICIYGHVYIHVYIFSLYFSSRVRPLAILTINDRLNFLCLPAHDFFGWHGRLKFRTKIWRVKLNSKFPNSFFIQPRVRLFPKDINGIYDSMVSMTTTKSYSILGMKTRQCVM